MSKQARVSRCETHAARRHSKLDSIAAPCEASISLSAEGLVTSAGNVLVSEDVDAADRQTRWKRFFAKIDRSGDGQIDKKEYRRIVKAFCDYYPSLHVDFDSWDDNHDGFLSENEFCVFLEAMWRILGERSFLKLESRILDEVYKRDRASITTADAKNEDAWEELQHIANVADGTEPCESIDVARELRIAMDSSDPKVLRRAIREARRAGSDKSLIVEAHKKQRALEASEKLEEAMHSEDAGVLSIALRDLHNAGAEHELIEEATRLLRILTARERIKVATSRHDVHGLISMIDEGRKAGLEQSELQDASKVLSKLRAEDTLKWAVESEDPEDLRVAITDCLAAGVDMETITSAERLLPNMARRQTARMGLVRSIAHGSVDEVRASVAVAESEGVHSKDLERANRLLLRTKAREDLVSALHGESRTALENAIQRARAAALQCSDLDCAVEMLARLELKSKLNQAIIGQDANALRKAIDAISDFVAAGGFSGVTHEELEKAEAKLARLAA
eukprot:TRINITY_DN4076_c1_g3_i1.p1 TRINITY_DN4076_c1_g3~~TRINITY_DN4076_c1_g3_i1.p1  ORF type:complete len:509 (-),score=85.22 TRINITY_DN4076_c1_g3_i1:47-1573(-)